MMRQCDTCGNEYDRAFEVRYEGRTYAFDSLECAVHKLAPTCEHCGCRVLGHGVEQEGSIFCCAHCARHMGKTDVRDRGGDGSGAHDDVR
jgi:hypothetical protein